MVPRYRLPHGMVRHGATLPARRGPLSARMGHMARGYGRPWAYHAHRPGIFGATGGYGYRWRYRLGYRLGGFVPLLFFC